jgi:hypothetical protein
MGGGGSWNKRFIKGYIKYNNPQSAYALHILQHKHEYDTIDKTMILLKPIKNTPLLTPYEQFSIKSIGHMGRLIPEQNTGEPNPFPN